MKILSWNIQKGGSHRLPIILNKVLRLAPDIFIPTEFRVNSFSAALVNKLISLYPYHALADGATPNVNKWRNKKTSDHAPLVIELDVKC